MRTPTRWIILLLVIISTACGGSEAPKQTASAAVPPAPAPTPPSSEAAQRIIADSAEWSDFQSPYSAWSLPTSKSALTGAALAGAKDLEKGGWISLRSGDVVLTAKARDDKRFLIRPNGSIDIVPLAKKEIVSAGVVRPGPENELQVDLEWKWVPNEVGSSFRSGVVKDRFAAIQHATATLQPADGGGWEILRIVAK